MGEFQVSSKSSQGGNGDRYVVSKSSSTKTSSKNGVTKKVVTTKLKYSDGTEELTFDETETHN